jgi:hypothetical protein
MRLSAVATGLDAVITAPRQLTELLLETISAEPQRPSPAHHNAPGIPALLTPHGERDGIGLGVGRNLAEATSATMPLTEKVD